MLLFLINAIGLGAGLAMDAFSVSAVNGMNEPDMPRSRACKIAGTFGIFQTAMPLIGWFCVNRILHFFQAIQRYIPGIAMLLLFEIGFKMIREGREENRRTRKEQEEEETGNDPSVTGEFWNPEYASTIGAGKAKTQRKMTDKDLLVQGVATSIDALSLIIGIITFAICLGGIQIGKRFGTMLSGNASILGGVILILIGIEIMVKAVVF